LMGCKPAPCRPLAISSAPTTCTSSSATSRGSPPSLPPNPPEPLTIPPRVAPDAASVAHGQHLYQASGCGGCHGADGRARTTLPDAKGYPVVSRDLTVPWSFRGGSAPEDVWRRVTTGLAPSPMPSIAAQTTPEERWDLVDFVLSLQGLPP